MSLNLNRGESVALLGLMAGKTTLFYIMGLIKRDVGSILLDKNEISSYPCIEGQKWDLATYPKKAQFLEG